MCVRDTITHDDAGKYKGGKMGQQGQKAGKSKAGRNKVKCEQYRHRRSARPTDKRTHSKKRYEKPIKGYVLPGLNVPEDRMPLTHKPPAVRPHVCQELADLSKRASTAYNDSQAVMEDLVRHMRKPFRSRLMAARKDTKNPLTTKIH